MIFYLIFIVALCNIPTQAFPMKRKLDNEATSTSSNQRSFTPSESNDKLAELEQLARDNFANNCQTVRNLSSQWNNNKFYFKDASTFELPFHRVYYWLFKKEEFRNPNYTNLSPLQVHCLAQAHQLATKYTTRYNPSISWDEMNNLRSLMNHAFKERPRPIVARHIELLLHSAAYGMYKPDSQEQYAISDDFNKIIKQDLHDEGWKESEMANTILATIRNHTA